MQTTTKAAVNYARFPVSKVARATMTLPEVPYKTAVEALLCKPPSELHGEEAPPQPVTRVEACSRYYGQLVAEVYFHPVVAAVHLAFMDHRPLVLSPDIVWLMVAQGFANHVNANAEELRHQFVQHTGKINIIVERNDFIKGSLENPWSEVFSEFSNSIRKHLGATTHDLLLPDFSTTGTVERAAAEVVLLDAMQSFFSYELHTLCGIPEITLEGTPEDWSMLARRTHQLGQFGLKWWTDILAPLFNEFTAASRGRVNTSFWQSIYKLQSQSGGPYTTGWLTAFFPYLKDWQTGQFTDKNRWLTQGDKKLHELLYPPANFDPEQFGAGPTTDAFPGGMARAPFQWKYLRQSFEMEFLGGFVGVQQDAETLSLRPEIGWAVREQSVTLK